MTRIFLTLTAALGLGALPALAQGSPAITDTDGDGVFSLEEVQAAVPEVTEETFTSMDTNADGEVDRMELAAAVEAGTIESST